MEITRVSQTIVRQRWLIIELIRRELKLRYRGTWLGFVWTMLNPLIMTVIYTLVFSVIMRIGIPNFPAFLISGLLPWMMWFTESITSGTNCLVDHAGFLRNAVFPSEILPIVSVGTGMMNYLFSLPILLLLLAFFQIPLSWHLLALPVVMVVQFLFTLGIAFFMATYNVFFRDLRYIVQHLLLALFFLTPIMFDFSIIPERLHLVFKLNPLTTIIDSYRNIFFYNAWPNWENLGYVLLLGVVLVIFGSQIFGKNKELFAEYL